MILHLKEGIVAEGRGLRDAVFGSGEIEEIAVTPEAPVFQTRDLETEIASVLIAQAGSLGESIAEGVIEIWRVIAIESDEGNAFGGVKARAGNKAEAPFIAS